MWRRVWSIVVAFAWIVGTSAAVADENRSLALPDAMSPEALAKESARGEGQADATADTDQVHVNASAQASVGPITIGGPITTGNIGSFPGIDGASGQVSTGFGNIQQGVSAVAIAN
jgi:hypothetical protein